MKITDEEYKKRLADMIEQGRKEGKKEITFFIPDFCAGICQDPNIPGEIWATKMNSCCFTAGRWLRYNISTTPYSFVAYPNGRARYTVLVR